MRFDFEESISLRYSIFGVRNDIFFTIFRFSLLKSISCKNCLINLLLPHQSKKKLCGQTVFHRISSRLMVSTSLNISKKLLFSLRYIPSSIEFIISIFVLL